MAANTKPIFVLQPQISWGTITAANTATDGTGTVVTVFTADATEGSFVERLRIRPLGTNSSATVLRVFINNGSANTTATNNSLWTEISLATTTASNTSSQPEYEIPMNLGLPPGYKLNVTLGTAGTAGFAVTAVGGKY